MFILRRKGGITAKELATLCNAHFAKLEERARNYDFIINYGQKGERAHLNRHVDFNKRRVQKFLEKKGILIPPIYDKNMDSSNLEFPILARQNYHSKGRDIVFLENNNELQRFKRNKEWQKYDYLTKYIYKNSEYRVHILKDFDTIVNVKVNGEDDREETIRCRDNGWKQVEYRGEFRKKLIRLAEEVIECLGYDFGAVDIIRDKHNKFYVLEVNSAPGLEERKLKIYANYFLKKEKEWKSK